MASVIIVASDGWCRCGCGNYDTTNKDPIKCAAVSRWDFTTKQQTVKFLN